MPDVGMMGRLVEMEMEVPRGLAPGRGRLGHKDEAEEAPIGAAEVGALRIAI